MTKSAPEHDCHKNYARKKKVAKTSMVYLEAKRGVVSSEAQVVADSNLWLYIRHHLATIRWEEYNTSQPIH